LTEKTAGGGGWLRGCRGQVFRFFGCSLWLQLNVKIWAESNENLYRSSGFKKNVSRLMFFRPIRYNLNDNNFKFKNIKKCNGTTLV
jgi:hypothetical protein